MKIAMKREQRQARLALPSGSDLSERKAGRLGVAGSVAGHIGEITVAESRPEAFTRPTSRKAEAHDAKDNAPAHLDHRLAAFAEERYDLRHNLLTGQAEFRPKGQDAAAFLPLPARDLNSLCRAAHEAGIPCWDRDVSRFVTSDRLPDYHPFRDYFDRLPRIASFIATSNSHELLSDPSGSRRFLCVEVERPIDSTDIEHAQIYAQLKAMLLGGERHGFTTEEEAEIQRANVAFYRTFPAEEAFARHFRAARPDEEALSVSLPELIALLRKRQPGTLTGISMQEFSRALVAAGVERKHTEKGNRYRIVPLEAYTCKH